MGDEELAAVIQAVRDRARSAAHNGSVGLDGVHVPDLLPLAHARDAAEAKVAAIGTVNPRPPGLKNSIAQGFKKLIARMLDWHVREQVEFNRATMACTQASLEALTELSRTVAALASHYKRLEEVLESRVQELREEFFVPLSASLQQNQELLDVRKHWAEWRAGFEDRRNVSEIHMLRTISELQSSFQHRVTLMEQNFRESVNAQHADYKDALAHSTVDVQERLWKDLVKMRGEVEALIATELRLLRQKLNRAPVAVESTAQPTAAAAPATEVPIEIPIDRVAIDWMRFADAFRGSEAVVRERQKHHVRRFEGTAQEILDLGCGRGEFLEVAREAGLTARGIDQNAECIALCLEKGLAVERADLFAHLEGLPDNSLGGVFCSQVVEHLPPERVPALVRLLAAKLRQGALVAIETPNPECLAIFSTYFYIDPTHTRPVPAALLRFYLEEAGFGRIEVERFAPASDSIPAVKDLPASVVDALFGGLDYAIFARKL